MLTNAMLNFCGDTMRDVCPADGELVESKGETDHCA
jgi:hypothetical protein